MGSTGGFGQPQSNMFGGNQNTGGFGTAPFGSNTQQNNQNTMNNYQGFMSSGQPQTQNTGFGSSSGGNSLFD